MRLIAGTVVLWTATATAQEGATDATPALPRSIEVRVAGAYVRTSPTPEGSRRGTLAMGARIRPLESVLADGCDRPWYRIADEAWVCGNAVVRRETEPDARRLPIVAEGQLVPHSYGFAREDGARLFKTLEDAADDEWDREFDPHTGLHLRAKVSSEGRDYYHLVDGGYVPTDDVRPARPSSFQGLRFGAERLAGWIAGQGGIVRSSPGRGKVLRRLGRRYGVAFLEQTPIGRALWLKIADGEWASGRDVRVVTPVQPPPPVGPDEHWIHVSRERQILTAYEGRRPVFATLVSTGRHGAATPAGIFRIWAKLATTVMADESDTVDERPYTMQGVPWAMFFNEGVALHGAYWHDDFGRRRSHGCVNLAPADAAFLFDWSSPSLPPGWTGVLPARSDPGTIVVVE